MKSNPKYSGLGIALGAALGAALGVIAGNIGVWLGIGVAIGVVLGAAIRQKQPACPHCDPVQQTRDAPHRRMS